MFNAPPSCQRSYWCSVECTRFPHPLICWIGTDRSATCFLYTNPKERNHFDGLPVDVASAGIVAALFNPPQVHSSAGASNAFAFALYHCVNSLDDGVSLDSFVDWIGASGYPLHVV